MKTKTTNKPTKPKNPIGNPTKYNIKVHPVIAKVLARNGLIDKQIAEEMDITEQTFINWKKKYPEFSLAVLEGKQTPIEKVVNSLLNRACGMELEEKILAPIYTIDKKTGKKTRTNRMEVVEKRRKQIPPDTSAAILYLKNRAPEEWRDKQEVEHTGQITYKVIPDEIDTNEQGD